MTFTRQIQWIYMIVCRILLLQALQFYMLYTVTSLLLPAFTYYEDILEPTHSLDYLCYLHAFPGCPTYLLHLRFCHFLELLPFHGGNGFTCLTLTWLLQTQERTLLPGKLQFCSTAWEQKDRIYRTLTAVPGEDGDNALTIAQKTLALQFEPVFVADGEVPFPPSCTRT